ncbi:MAG: hypothetical protein R2867_23630 [Caldilineaceae bacterium]
MKAWWSTLRLYVQRRQVNAPPIPTMGCRSRGGRRRRANARGGVLAQTLLAGDAAQAAGHPGHGEPDVVGRATTALTTALGPLPPRDDLSEAVGGAVEHRHSVWPRPVQCRIW